MVDKRVVLHLSSGYKPPSGPPCQECGKSLPGLLAEFGETMCVECRLKWRAKIQQQLIVTRLAMAISETLRTTKVATEHG
jgi:hypothetical protein